MMDVIKYFNTKKRMCKFYKGTCHLCPMGKDNTKTHLLCFKLQQEKPEIADAIVELWAKEHPVKTYKSVFLEKFPDAKIEHSGTPCPCIIYIFGEKAKPVNCGTCGCVYCWNREVEEVWESNAQKCLSNIFDELLEDTTIVDPVGGNQGREILTDRVIKRYKKGRAGR